MSKWLTAALQNAVLRRAAQALAVLLLGMGLEQAGRFGVLPPETVAALRAVLAQFGLL